MQPLDEHLFRESALGIDELNPEARHLQVAGTSTGRRAEGGEGAQLSPTRRRFQKCDLESSLNRADFF